jgi:hypothetical protein
MRRQPRNVRGMGNENINCTSSQIKDQAKQTNRRTCFKIDRNMP